MAEVGERVTLLQAKGSALSQADVDEIGRLWETVFADEGHRIAPHEATQQPSTATIKLVRSWNPSQWQDHTFFFLKLELPEGAQIIGACRLLPLVIQHQGADFPVMGLADVAVHSAYAGRGYGRQLMEAVVAHASQNGQTVVGFCLASNSPFYRRTGFQILPGVISETSWIHIDEQGGVVTNDWDHDVLFYEPASHRRFVDTFSDPAGPVLLPRSHW
jgi:predicted N-acetyltransferase YhbS